MFGVLDTPITKGKDVFSVFTSLFVRWDSVWYLNIAQSGYPLGIAKPFGGLFQYYTPIADPQWAFFPLYPAAMRALATLIVGFNSVNTPSLIVSGIIVSNTAFFVSIYFFYKLTNKLFNSTKTALISIAFYSFSIATVFYSAVYSEALFMALALGSFYYLEEKRYCPAIVLGVLAAFTRSDGFLVAVPFFIYGLQIKIPKIYEKCKCGCGKLFEIQQSFIKFHLTNVKLLLVSAVVASPYLVWNLVGYFVAGGIFPIQEIARRANWGAYPPFISQFSLYQTSTSFDEFLITALILIVAIPTIYFMVKIRKVFTAESNTLKYWALYASIAYILFTQSFVFSIIRYAIPMLPIYWVSAKIYTKNRAIGLILLGLMVSLSIIGTYLFEIQSIYLL
ncbi:MAG: mannosyltransferase family protein [Candidatus Bathyarchaeia archaeon]